MSDTVKDSTDQAPGIDSEGLGTSEQVSGTAPDSKHMSPTIETASTPQSQPGPSRPTGSAPAAQYGLSKEHLEQEVEQVMGTLSSWWGGVKKQSVSALSSIKADIDKTVVQAQADFEQLRTAKIDVVRKDPAQFAAEQQADKDAMSMARGGTGESETSATSDASASFLGRLTSSTTQLQTNLQTTFKSTMAAAASNPTIANASDLSAHLAENLRLSSAKQNIQLSVKQAEKLAEEYLQRGDQLRKEAEKWMSEAVKVVPPSEGGQNAPAVSWDGSDWYGIVSQAPYDASGSSTDTELHAEGNLIRKSPPRALAGSRKDALLARLREDKELVSVDPRGPSVPAEQRKRYERWLAEKWSGKKTPLVQVETEMAGSVRMAVVPEIMSDEEFWRRYMYIRDTILEEDERRQQLLKATEQQTDDFTWDDEPDDQPEAAETPKLQTSRVDSKPVASGRDAPPSKVPAAPSPSTSPRESEESYDVVSDNAVRGDASAARFKEPKPEVKDERADDGDDSDWE